MGIDPLSSATRATKRNLLVASVVAITYKAFDVRVEKIPVAGLEINFDNRLLVFLLLAILIYFIFCFSIYYFIDIRNFEQTAHQAASSNRRLAAAKRFPQRYIKYIVRMLNRALPKNRQAELSSNFSIAFEAKEPYKNVTSLYVIQSVLQRPIGVNNLSRDQCEDYSRLDELLKTYLAKYQHRRLRYWYFISIRYYAVEAAYLVRNYLLDGLLPLSLGVAALFALCNVLPVHWLQRIVP